MMRLDYERKDLRLINLLSVMLLFIGLSISSAQANFVSNETSAVAACPFNHKMYYIGATPPASTQNFPVTSQALNWTAGNTTRTFTFTEASGNKEFVINFPILLDLNNFFDVPPFYGSLNGITTNAINLDHDSPAVKTNHSMNVSVNRSVTKVGYKIQDLDSTGTTGRVPYIEQVDVSANQGQLTFNANFHTRNAAGNVVTGRSGLNCSTGQCTIDAAWNYKLANTALNLKHNNSFTQRNSPHTIGYSDFFFCLAPPKIIVNKLLDGSRVDGDDQFRIELRRTDNNAFVEAFTTTGSNDVVTDNTTTVTTLTEGVNYTISEQIINGNLLDYQTTYTCSNATTGTDVVFSSGEMLINNAGTRRTFAINNVSYGDEITCNVTNTPSQYTFSGIVFNDNGGITASSTTRQDISSTFTSNASYFNTVFDSATESGIYDASMSIRLTDCNGTNITTTSANPQPVSNIQATRGRYNFTVPASALTNRTRVCVVQDEPSTWDYTVDTNTDNREVTLVANVYTYSNLDFGEVKANNAALVLIKSQYVHECNNNLDYQAVSTNAEDPTVGFSINPIRGVSPGKCIAYSVRAYNRGHVGLQQVQIRDQLQITPVTSVFQQPAPLFIPTSTASPSVAYDSNGIIQSNLFSLAATPVTASQPNSATLYFNTKYGTTQSN
jgi:hypothetical protein